MNAVSKVIEQHIAVYFSSFPCHIIRSTSPVVRRTQLDPCQDQCTVEGGGLVLCLQTPAPDRVNQEQSAATLRCCQHCDLKMQARVAKRTAACRPHRRETSSISPQIALIHTPAPLSLHLFYTQCILYIHNTYPPLAAEMHIVMPSHISTAYITYTYIPSPFQYLNSIV